MQHAREDEKCIQNLSRKSGREKPTSDFGDMDVERIILKSILNNG
jgi:hypothetical protein